MSRTVTSETPQQNMTPEVFLEIMKHQGVLHNRFAEYFAFKIYIDQYRISRIGPVSLLEVGSGLGDIGQHLEGIVDIYIGIDTNDSFVSYAKARFPKLSFHLQNFFLLRMSNVYDIVCAPYTLVNLFDFRRQEVFIRKAVAHANLVLIDTILPDTHGVHENVTRELDESEFGGAFGGAVYFMCERQLEEIAQSLGVVYSSMNFDIPTSFGTFRHSMIAFKKTPE